MSKTALLIIDMQKDLKKETPCKLEFENAVMYINEVSDFFRTKNLPVVIVQDLSVGEVDSDGFDCVDELKISENDYRISKKYNNAFWETELDALLKEQGVDAVIVSGFAVEYCIVFSYNGAKERGYKTFLLQNGLAGYDSDEIKGIQLLRSVIAYDALEYFLE